MQGRMGEGCDRRCEGETDASSGCEALHGELVNVLKVTDW